jgi:hypothetical protein
LPVRLVIQGGGINSLPLSLTHVTTDDVDDIDDIDVDDIDVDAPMDAPRARGMPLSNEPRVVGLVGECPFGLAKSARRRVSTSPSL